MSGLHLRYLSERKVDERVERAMQHAFRSGYEAPRAIDWCAAYALFRELNGSAKHHPAYVENFWDAKV